MGIGIGHGIWYRRYSKQSIGIGIGISHHGIVPSQMKYIYLNPILYIQLENIACKVPNTVKIM